MKAKLEKMRKEANYHQKDLEGLTLSTSQELDSINIQREQMKPLKKLLRL